MTWLIIGSVQDLEFLRGFGEQLQSSGIIEPLSKKRQTFV